MITNFKNMDFVEQLITLLGLLAIALFITYALSTKTFKGYYLYSGTTPYQIWINWENAPDEVAFETFDHELVINTLERLNKNPAD